MSKKVQVNFSDSQIELLDNFRGELGDTISEVVRSIVISWLSEKGIITTIASTKMNDKRENNSEG